MIGVKKTKGYSLMELLVVMMLFGLSMTILTQTYINFVKLSHRTSNAALVQEDMRYVLEYASRAIRNTPVDYDAAWSPASTTLKLAQQSGMDLIIVKANGGDARCADSSGAACLLLSLDGGISFAPMTSKRVNVDDFSVYVYPASSPFVLNGATGLYDQNVQPFVTIKLKLSYLSNDAKERVGFTAQTSISSRVYVR